MPRALLGGCHSNMLAPVHQLGLLRPTVDNPGQLDRRRQLRPVLRGSCRSCPNRRMRARPWYVRVLDSAGGLDRYVRAHTDATKTITSRTVVFRFGGRKREVMPWAHRPAPPSPRPLQRSDGVESTGFSSRRARTTQAARRMPARRLVAQCPVVGRTAAASS